MTRGYDRGYEAVAQLRDHTYSFVAHQAFMDLSTTRLMNSILVWQDLVRQVTPACSLSKVRAKSSCAFSWASLVTKHSDLSQEAKARSHLARSVTVR